MGRPRTDRWAEYSSGSGGTALVFTYIVQSGDRDADGIWLPENFLRLRSGTIRATADNTVDATLTYAEPGLQPGHKVDGTSTDATLSALTVNDGTTEHTIDLTTPPYTQTVGNAVETVTLTATPTHTGASVSAVTLGGTAIADDDFTDGITVPDLDDGDNVIVVTVTAEDGSTELSYTVTVTREAAATNNDATGAPEITGTPQVGQTLTAGMGDIDDDDGPPTTTFPLGYSFQWVRVAGSTETDITGETDITYSPTSADEGSTIKVVVSFTDDAGNPETVPSDPVGPVVPAAGACPTGNDWCATMTVGVFSSSAGAVFGFASTSYGQLGDTTIDYGRSYEVETIILNEIANPYVVVVELDAHVPLGSVFNLGGTEFTADAEESSAGLYNWDRPANFTWIEGQEVTVSANLAPAPESATVNGTTLVLTHSEDLDTGSTPAADRYTVKLDGGTERTVSSVSVGTRTVTLTLETAVTATDIVTVDYDVPASSPLQDESGLDAPDSEDFPVNNNTVATSDATLSALTVNDGTTDHTIDLTAPPYTQTVGNAVETVTLTATPTHTGASVSAVTLGGTAIADTDFTDGMITVPDLVEGDNVIVVTVTAEDGSTATYTVTVTQEAANSPPVFPAPDPRELSVAENVPLGTDVGAPVTATDPDDDPLTYSLTTSPHSGHFQIDSATGQLVTNIAVGHVFNHERDPNVSAVQVVAEDGRGGTAQITVTVSVTDVDEPPDAPVAVTVTGSGTTSLGVSWTAPSNQWRPDIDDYDVQYREVGASSWTDGPQDVTGTNTTIMSVDAGKSYEVQVRATNDEGDGPWAISGGTTNTASTDGRRPRSTWHWPTRWARR